MGLNKIPSFQEVKDWANTNLVTSVNGNTGDVSVSETPSGVITMWSGTTSDVPSGWTLCDGTDGTPDLRNRFIAGAGGQYGAGDTGGADSVQLSESEMPSHSHGISQGVYGNSGGHTGSADSGRNSVISQDNVVQSAGGDDSHENRPPFYAMAFIMKV